MLYIHGYIESIKSPTVRMIVDAYMLRGTHNILILDWSTLADGLYPTAVRKSSQVSIPRLELLRFGIAKFTQFQLLINGSVT